MRYLIIILALIVPLSAQAKDVKIKLYEPKIRAKRQYQTGELLESYLAYSALRHKVLADNMANINTPGYKAKDVAKPKKHQHLMGGQAGRKLRLKVTDGDHIRGSKRQHHKFNVEEITDPFEIKPNGNNVSLPQQMAKITENRDDYNATLNSFNQMQSLFITVLGK